jgi:hypothetical protein
MAKKRSLSQIEIKLIKEQAIREYKQKIENNSGIHNQFSSILDTLKRIAPINIIIGLVAAIVLIMLKGWKELFETLIIATIWITLVSTVLSGLAKKK